MITNYLVPKPTDVHRQIENKLLTYGGKELVCLPEDNLERLLDGEIMTCQKVIMKKGMVSECHLNALTLYLNHPGLYTCAYGYALSNDGLWRQHSWLVRKDGAIIETTEKRLLYFGFLLNEKDIKEQVTM